MSEWRSVQVFDGVYDVVVQNARIEYYDVAQPDKEFQRPLRPKDEFEKIVKDEVIEKLKNSIHAMKISNTE